MASVIVYDQTRMKEIEDTTVVSGSVSTGGNLLLTTRQGAQIDAGYIKGDKGDTGPVAPIVAGIISPFAGSVPPMGWMICNGAAVSRTTYPDLFTAIGTTYGAGDGTSTFNLPDLRGRVAVGLDPNQTEFDNLGEKGGEKTHTLTTAEMPAHTHSISGKSGVDDSNFSGNLGAFAAADAVTPYDQNTGSTGGGAAHNNLQPYAVTNYIISIGTSAAVAGGVPIQSQYIGRGSSAERDSTYGVPGTDADRVALANRQIIWYNSTTRKFETYYATTGLAGLTAPGIAGTSGWYQEATTLAKKVVIPTPANNTAVDEISVTRQGSIVTFQGRTTRNGGGTALFPVGTIPVGFRPTLSIFPQWALAGVGVLGQVSPDGSAITPFSSGTGDFMFTATWSTDPTVLPY